MRLKYKLESVDMGDEIVSVPVGKGANNAQGILKMNKEGKEILDLLEVETTEERIVNELMTKYSNSRETIMMFVHNILETLRRSGMLEE